VNAVNLIPGDSRGSGRTGGGLSLGPAHAVLGLLILALGLTTLYVLSTNTISKRQAQLATVQVQVAQAQAASAHLTNYSQFAQLAQSRITTIRQIAATRFDWHAALADLARVVPADTSLQTLQATVSSTATSAGGGSGPTASGSSLRGAATGPAFELRGCTKTQDDVARLLSRLRLINGVTRVTLSDSAKTDSASAAAPAGTTSSSAAAGCGKGAPTFDLIVFFAPIPGAAPTATGATGTPVTSTTPGSTTATGTTTTTPGSTTTTAASATTQPVTATPPSAGATP
jgi:Tfp pilus assembly protein PilN